MSYFSKFYLMLRNTFNIYIDDKKEIPVKNDKLIVDDSSAFCKALRILGQQELVTYDHQETILYEFRFLSENIKKTCHQLDENSKAIQFADTDQIIGQDLIYAAQFIRSRYHNHQQFGDSWISMMGLFMILLHVLNTEAEVKRQLLHQTQLGREVVLDMMHVLKNKKSMKGVELSKETQLEFLLVCLDINEQDQAIPCWFTKLNEICSELALMDTNWEHKNDYYKVVLMADELYL